VPRKPATLFDSQRRHRKIELVVEHDDLFSNHTVAVSKEANCISRIIHICLRNSHGDTQLAYANFIDEGTLFAFAKLCGVPLRKYLYYISAYVVART
jgi:hypothetical protein